MLRKLAEFKKMPLNSKKKKRRDRAKAQTMAKTSATKLQIK